ncbi:F-box DNA helicase 1-like isoform X1 [Babylonia areolata]
MGEEHQGPPRKRLHLDVVQSVRLSQSEEGTASLRQPVDRAHPRTCAEQAMTPRYNTRIKFRPPRRVRTPDDQKRETDSASNSTQGSGLGTKDLSFLLEPSCVVPRQPSPPCVGMSSSKKTGKKQSSIIPFMFCQGSSSSASSSNSFVTASTSNDRKRFEPQVSTGSPSKISSPVRKVARSGTGDKVHRTSEGSPPPDRIEYGSPSKMYSPIKKVSEAGSVYIVVSDDSDDCQEEASDRPCSRSDDFRQRNSEGMKVFLSQSRAPDSKSSRGAGTQRKESSASRSVNKGVKKKTLKKRMSKQEVSPHQRMLASVSSTLGLSSTDFDEADEEDFASVPSVRICVDVGPTFGLLSDSVVDTVEENWFHRMPVEIVENIFCNLPMVELCHNVSRVCVNWNNIVSNPSFLPWKKLYHKLKNGDRGSKAHIRSLIQQEDMDSCRLLKLISFMQKFRVVTPDNNVCAVMQSHPKYSWALALLKEKASHCIKNGEPNPWSLLCALVCVSATVEDVHCAVRLLTSSRSRQTCVEVVECFYCMATFLLEWKYTSQQLFSLLRDPSYLDPISNSMVESQGDSKVMNLERSQATGVLRGLHYRVFYALYLYENSFTSSHAMLQQAMVPCSGQQSIIKYSRGDTGVRLTHEQMRIINYTPELRSGEIIKVFAYAGTGKTTVLRRYTQMRPHLKFLLIVFNKSVCTHAQSTFPPNVTCRTGHSLAFAAVGRRYAAKKNLNAGNLRLYDVAMTLKSRKTNSENLFVRAKRVMETLKNFLSSGDDRITTQHTPLTEFGIRIMDLDFSQKMLYVEDADYYWGRMKDLDDERVKMTHDGYLKLYQLWQPTLNNYDIILVDEAQDLSPALLTILEQQNQPKIFVGDQHQQIYAFRGAVNAMEGLVASKTFYLTQSFRFGPEIAQVANTLLENLKNDTSRNIVGHGTPGTINGDQVGQLAVLCRTNYSVFTEADKFCSSAEPSARIAIVGGLEGLGMSMLKDIYTLMLSESDRKKGNLTIHNKFIATFPNLAELEKFAMKVMDVELLGKVRVIRSFVHNFPRCANRIEAHTISNIQQADVVFSTAHKAKGLEFATVRLTPDFLELQSLLCFQLGQPLYSVRNEDVNILYVAVTRAKNALIMSRSLRQMHVMMGGGCYYPVLTEQLTKEGVVEMKCVSNQETFTPQAFTLYRPSVTLGNKVVEPAGVVSPALLRLACRDYADLFGDGDEQNLDGDEQNLDQPVGHGGNNDQPIPYFNGITLP